MALGGGGMAPDPEAARRLERLGLAGLAWHRLRLEWEVVVSQAAEPRWTGTDPRLAALHSAYRIALGGGQA
jgi:hypothetical protein